jgi:hypothetical protein
MLERSGFALQGEIRLANNAIFGQEFVCVAKKTAKLIE